MTKQKRYYGFIPLILKTIERLRPPQLFLLSITSLFLVSSIYLFIKIINQVEGQIFFFIIIMSTLTLWFALILLLGKSGSKNQSHDKIKCFELKNAIIKHLFDESDIKRAPFHSEKVLILIFYKEAAALSHQGGKIFITPIYVQISKL